MTQKSRPLAGHCGLYSSRLTWKNDEKLWGSRQNFALRQYDVKTKTFISNSLRLTNKKHDLQVIVLCFFPKVCLFSAYHCVTLKQVTQPLRDAQSKWHNKKLSNFRKKNFIIPDSKWMILAKIILTETYLCNRINFFHSFACKSNTSDYFTIIRRIRRWTLAVI